MKDYLLSLSRHMEESLKIGSRFRLPARFRKIKKIFFCGMGGSAISGDILRVLVRSTSPWPMIVQRAPGVPAFVDSETLVIFSSYSGNTLEVLESYREVRARKSALLVVTSGGRLAEEAKRHGIPWLQLPSGLPPRCAIGYLTFVLVPLFRKLGWMRIQDRELKEATARVQKVSSRKVKDIVQKILGRPVYLYGVSGLTEVVGLRWKTQLAENAKVVAQTYTLPEMFHNEIEGWSRPERFHRGAVALFFRDVEDPSWLVKKRRAVYPLIRKSGARVLEVSAGGRSKIGRLFSLIALGDWVSYGLAQRRGVDPLDIHVIEKLKKIL